MKLQAKGVQLRQIETPVHAFSCEFSEIYKKTYFLNVCERLLKSKIFR